ncbi:DUF6417 family protein [Streptomyces rishiriensis]|uniref:DUF6417 family protein n=1 Tax=Streptomyces rishiriensis TaxID=68264 RepID=UPI0037D4FE1A
MGDYDHLDLDEIDFAPAEHDAERLRLLTLGEAHDLLRVLRTVAQEGGVAAGEAEPLGAGDRCPHPLGELIMVLGRRQLRVTGGC